MDRFLEESVSKHHRAAEEVLYYASWVVMIVSAILAFMYLNVMFYSFSISMLVMTLVFTGIAVYIFFFHDRGICFLFCHSIHQELLHSRKEVHHFQMLLFPFFRQKNLL